MRSLRSASTWPHPNHQQPIAEQETGQREGGREGERNRAGGRERRNHADKKVRIGSKELGSRKSKKD